MKEAATRHFDEEFGRMLSAEGFSLCQYAFSILGNWHQAEDAVSQTFLKAWQNRTNLRDHDKLAAWLKKICRNEALGIFRKTRKENLCSVTSEHLSALAESPARVDEGEFHNELLEKLPQNLRTCAEMFFFEGKKYAEIGRICALPLSTVRGRISQTRKHWKKEIVMSSTHAVPARAEEEPTLKPQNGRVEWRGMKVRFLGLRWGGTKTFYGADGRRLTRRPQAITDAIIKDSGHPIPRASGAPLVNLYWGLRGPTYTKIDSEVYSLEGRMCTPSRTGIVSGNDSHRVHVFTCGVGEQGVRALRMRSTIWGEERREGPGVCRYVPEDRGDLAHQGDPEDFWMCGCPPEWGVYLFFGPRPAKERGTSEVILAYSSHTAEKGCRIFGVRIDGQEYEAEMRTGGGGVTPEGHLRVARILLPFPPEEFNGLVLYPVYRAQINWGRITLGGLPC